MRGNSLHAPQLGPCTPGGYKRRPGAAGSEGLDAVRGKGDCGLQPAADILLRHHDHLLQPLPQAAAGRDELPAQEGQAGAQHPEAIQVSSLPPPVMVSYRGGP